MRVQFRLGATSPDERFAPHSFDGILGSRVPHRFDDGQGNVRELGLVTIVAAEVAEDGRAVFITYETDEGPAL